MEETDIYVSLTKMYYPILRFSSYFLNQIQFVYCNDTT